jgi:hypothetical protein
MSEEFKIPWGSLLVQAGTVALMVWRESWPTWINGVAIIALMLEVVVLAVADALDKRLERIGDSLAELRAEMEGQR